MPSTGEIFEKVLDEGKEPEAGRNKRSYVWSSLCQIQSCIFQKDSLNEGLKKHKCAVKRCNTNNGMATHTWHSVNWDAAKIKAFEEHIIRERIW